MDTMAIGCIVFALVFGSALLAMFVRSALSEHHLSAASNDVVKLGIALVATMSALVLSLLIASAKSAFDMRSNQLVQASADVILLNRRLGPLRAGDQGGACYAPALGSRHGGAILACRGY